MGRLTFYAFIAWVLLLTYFCNVADSRAARPAPRIDVVQLKGVDAPVLLADGVGATCIVKLSINGKPAQGLVVFPGECHDVLRQYAAAVAKKYPQASIQISINADNLNEI